MLGTLIQKELKAILISPKFVAVFAVCSILIILSVYIGIDEYRTAVKHYESVNAQLDQQMREETNWNWLRTNIVRRPNPMEIFVAGINNDIGRQCPINANIAVKLYGSRYSDQLIFSIFRSMDFMFIVQIVLSLFAILFTYDSICGERESGTLKLNFANPIPRTGYILSKLIGAWLGLIIPLLIPMLLGVVLLLVFKVPMTSQNWIQLLVLTGISALYFTFFICLGVFFSSLTRGPSASFLYLLVVWICFVLIIPRAGVMSAGQFIEVDTAAEIQSKYTRKQREISDQFNEWMNKASTERQSRLSALSKEEYVEKSKKIFEEFDKKLAEEDKRLTLEMDKYYVSLIEDWRNRKGELEKLGFAISRVSPASAFQLAAMNFAGTGLSLKTEYEDQLQDYKGVFSRFCAEKGKDNNEIFITSTDNKKAETIDITELPKFSFVETDVLQKFTVAVIDIAILVFYICIAVAGSFIVFIRYDVR